MEQIFLGGAQLAQLLEPELCMLLLVLSGGQEQCGNLLVAGLFGHGSKIGVFVSCLGFAGKGLPQILLGFGACVLISHNEITS